MVKDGTTIGDLLRLLPSCKPKDTASLIKMLPAMEPRYFSIFTSPLGHQNIFCVAVKVNEIVDNDTGRILFRGKDLILWIGDNGDEDGNFCLPSGHTAMTASLGQRSRVNAY